MQTGSSAEILCLDKWFFSLVTNTTFAGVTWSPVETSRVSLSSGSGF
ncbi:MULTISPECIES: hypothetical protein [Nostocales]|uniref:Uncharacterized protein n=3 Tax=Nostocales TaxID=1161 RepID=A0A8S9TCK8_9CYAN|nr:hypothetical protein [Tolypothrix bouteillei]KAF3889344.1 hypothetical protein DA73_0400030605 [Tolypothrix bouteillei VB521301]